jgi:hypothetical protein
VIAVGVVLAEEEDKGDEGMTVLDELPEEDAFTDVGAGEVTLEEEEASGLLEGVTGPLEGVTGILDGGPGTLEVEGLPGMAVGEEEMTVNEVR